MTNNEIDHQSGELEGEGKNKPWQTLISSPDVQNAISEGIKKIPELIDTHIKGTQRARRSTTSWLLLWTFSIALVVVGAVTWLTSSGKISSDALAFLLGVIIGAAFTFVRDFFPTSGQ